MSLELMFNQFVIGLCFGNGFFFAMLLFKKFFGLGVCS